MYASLLREEDGRLLLKDANLHATKNTLASQVGQDIAPFLHNACESCSDFPGH